MKKNPLRVLRAGSSMLSGPLLRDLSAENKKILAVIMIGNMLIVARNYFLAAVEVIANVGPLVTVLIGFPISMLITWWAYRRPSLRGGWRLWRPALSIGVFLGLNNVAALYVFLWLRPQFVGALSFLMSAMILAGPVIVRDVRNKRYSTILWPALAIPGIWAMVGDPADQGGGLQVANGPEVVLAGHDIPGWALGVLAIVISSSTYAYNSKKMESLAKDDSLAEVDLARAYILSSIPAMVFLAAGASVIGGGWAGVTGSNWPYLLLAAVGGLIGGGGRLLQVKAYDMGLKAATDAMLSPLNTLARILLGLLVELMMPSALQGLGIVTIFVASLGAASYQSRR